MKTHSFGSKSAAHSSTTGGCQTHNTHAMHSLPLRERCCPGQTYQLDSQKKKKQEKKPAFSLILGDQISDFSGHFHWTCLPSSAGLLFLSPGAPERGESFGARDVSAMEQSRSDWAWSFLSFFPFCPLTRRALSSRRGGFLRLSLQQIKHHPALSCGCVLRLSLRPHPYPTPTPIIPPHPTSLTLRPHP